MSDPDHDPDAAPPEDEVDNRVPLLPGDFRTEVDVLPDGRRIIALVVPRKKRPKAPGGEQPGPSAGGEPPAEKPAGPT